MAKNNFGRVLQDDKQINVPCYCTGVLLGYVMMPTSMWEDVIQRGSKAVEVDVFQVDIDCHSDGTSKPRDTAHKGKTSFDVVWTPDKFPVALSVDDESKALCYPCFSKLPAVAKISKDGDDMAKTALAMLALVELLRREHPFGKPTVDLATSLLVGLFEHRDDKLTPSPLGKRVSDACAVFAELVSEVVGTDRMNIAMEAFKQRAKPGS